MFLLLILLSLLFVLTVFGATYLLLRNTPYAPYGILLSLVFFEPFLLLIVTLLGYRKPAPLKPWFVFTPVVLGMCLTVFVAWRYRAEILLSLRAAWKASLLILGLAMASMLLATPIVVAYTSPAYIDWWNGELVNYSMFAQYFLGILHDPNYAPFFEQQTAYRYGAELFLAALSTLTAKAPLMLVEVLSAQFKMSAIIAFAVSFELIRKERNLAPMAAVIACTGFAFSAILSLNHVLAFLGSQAVTGSFILLCLGLLSQGIEMRRIQIFFALQLLFIVITYAEALPFLCGLAGIVFLEACWSKRKETAIAVVSIFAAGFLMNPMLLASRVEYMYRLRSAIAGFNVLGSPKEGILAYITAALGCRYPFVNVTPPPTSLIAVVTVLALAATLCAFAAATFKLRTLIFIAIPAALVLVHVMTGDQPEGSAYYKGYKAIAALNFYIFLALGCLADRLIRRGPRNWYSPAVHVVLAVCLGAFIAGNILVSSQAAAAIKGVQSVYFEPDFQRALKPVGTPDEPHLVLAHDMSAAIWDLMANYLHAPRMLLDANQAEIIFHIPSASLVEPTAFPDTSAKSAGPFPERIYHGKIIIPAIADNAPPAPFNLPLTLAAISPRLRLQEEKPLLKTQAFRLIEGALVIEKIP